MSKNIYEEISIKHLRKNLGFTLDLRLDKKYTTIKCPDLLMSNSSGYQFISEVKSFFQFPKKNRSFQGRSGEILGYEVDSEQSVKGLLEEVDKKWCELITMEPKYKTLPYVLIVFENNMYWDALGFLSKDIHRLFPNISGFMTLTKSAPKSSEWRNLTAAEYKTYIEKNADTVCSRGQFRWEIAINHFALNRLKTGEFLSANFIHI